jgi:hypothetical protein
MTSPDFRHRRRPRYLLTPRRPRDKCCRRFCRRSAYTKLKYKTAISMTDWRRSMGVKRPSFLYVYLYIYIYFLERGTSANAWIMKCE